MEMERKIFPAELAWVCGILLLAAGTALMERADFGLSMVVAPAYLLHLKLQASVSWMTFGAAEYLLQAVLLVLLSLILRRFRRYYLFSFVTAFIYGSVLDLCMGAAAVFPGEGMIFRCLYFVSGMLLCTFGIAFLFHTYIAPEAYELVVMEIAESRHLDSGKVKTVYDVTSCLTAVIMSLVFFGRLEGIRAGTFVCTALNGWLIGRFDRLLSKRLEFRDALPLRRYLNEGENT